MRTELDIVMAERLLERTEERRLSATEALDPKVQAAEGQYFTPRPVAEFLARQISLRGSMRVLDPGAGVGSLCAAMVARAIQSGGGVQGCHLVAVESDPSLALALAKTLRDCEQTGARAGIQVTTELLAGDFTSLATESLIQERPGEFDACIMNPPYKKIGARSPVRAALKQQGVRVSNLYAAFLALAIDLLRDGGELSAITPRSFANGPYFREFRELFLSRMALERLHLYETRGRVFRDNGVLQENVILRATRASRPPSHVLLSTSADHTSQVTERVVPYHEVVHPDDRERFIRIPTDTAATEVAEAIAALPASLDSLDLEVSTGRVVDFRVKESLRPAPGDGTVPLIYPLHLRGGRLAWPVLGGRKPNSILREKSTEKLLMPAGDYVLVKRFSSKEERRRVSATWVSCAEWPAGAIGFENHLNVFHHNGAGLEPELAAGLAVYLNSEPLDRFFRQFSGHTQVNATDLRALRYPGLGTLRRWGENAIAGRAISPSLNDVGAAGNHPAEPAKQAA